MYLEGAVQNGWSVPEMRNQRWQAMGGLPEPKPREADVIASIRTRMLPLADGRPLPATIPNRWRKSTAPATFDDESDSRRAIAPPTTRRRLRVADAPAAAAVRPFEALPVAGGPQRSVRAIQVGDSQPQGFRLAGDRPRRRAGRLGIAPPVGPGPGGVKPTARAERPLGCHGQLVCPCRALADKPASGTRFRPSRDGRWFGETPMQQHGTLVTAVVRNTAFRSGTTVKQCYGCTQAEHVRTVPTGEHELLRPPKADSATDSRNLNPRASHR